MKRTKIMATVLVATMALASFTACSKKEETTASKEQETVETSETTKETTESETTTESTTVETTVETTAPTEESLVPVFVAPEEFVNAEVYKDSDSMFIAYQPESEKAIVCNGLEFWGFKIPNSYELNEAPDSGLSGSTKINLYFATDIRVEDGSTVIIAEETEGENIYYNYYPGFVPMYYNSVKGCITGYYSGLECEVYYSTQEHRMVICRAGT